MSKEAAKQFDPRVPGWAFESYIQEYGGFRCFGEPPEIPGVYRPGHGFEPHGRMHVTGLGHNPAEAFEDAVRRAIEQEAGVAEREKTRADLLERYQKLRRNLASEYNRQMRTPEEIGLRFVDELLEMVELKLEQKKPIHPTCAVYGK